MASSRKSQQSPKAINRVAVALSGGLDSVVLLDTVCRANVNKGQHPTEIYAFHIHHGLQKSADDWLLFCERLAKKYQIHFDFRLLSLGTEKLNNNLEARARAARYEALADLCIEHGIEDLLLAHHQNDQAETVLLQLLRGSGVAGLSGMPLTRQYQTQNQSISLWRPLLNQNKAELEVYAKQYKLKWIEDPSNQVSRFRRNAIRHDVIPRLEKIQPEAVANLARSASLFSEAQTLLDRLALQDGEKIFVQDELLIKPLIALSKLDLPAANNVLRYWLKSHDVVMPSQERLQAWWRDLLGVSASANLEWIHDGHSIKLWRGRLQFASTVTGEWVFKSVAVNSKKPGLPASWVKEAQAEGLINTKSRLGAEKLQIKANTPRKALKNLFQEADVPPWQRLAPLLYINQELIAVAGVGVSYPHLVTHGPRVWPEWQVGA